jgi:glycosyltransferase involved in cell wall biosynthesis
VDVHDQVARRAFSGGRPLQLLFLSRLHGKKNVPLLLRALRLATPDTRSIELTVAGEGDPGYRAHLTELAQQLGLSERVTFVGHVDGDAKREALARADCFVLPSAHENFGLAVAEALGSGLPVIVTSGVALSTDVAAAGAGLVTEPEETALAAAIAWAADHPAALSEMSERAWQLARRDFSWDRSCGLLLDLYEELATPARREGGKRA